MPVAGWLTQERRFYDMDSDRFIPEDDPTDRRVVAGVCSPDKDMAVVAVEGDFFYGDELWKILGPGEPEPSEAEEAKEQARRAEERTRDDS